MNIRLMRGQVVVRETTPKPSDTIWTPDPTARQVKTHRGIVLGVGPPALEFNAVEVPHGFNVGDEVIYHFQHHQDAHTRPWTDGRDATWLPQYCVDGVIE
jgi:co-chaperonin GroES (HSP10)